MLFLMVIRYFSELPVHYEAVSPLLVSLVENPFASVELGGPLLTTQVCLGIERIDIASQIEVEVGVPGQDATRTSIQVWWHATGPMGRFVLLEGGLEISPNPAGMTILTLLVDYAPPLGATGGEANSLLLHRIAWATLDELRSRAGAAINAGAATAGPGLKTSASGRVNRMKAPAPLRILVVDDHPAVRAGVRSLLAQLAPEMTVSEAGNVEEAMTEAERSHPDVVVMDVRLGEGSGIEATREIRNRRPETRVLILTSFDDDEALAAAAMAGASGFVPKQVGSGKLLSAIREVAAGHNLFRDYTNLMFERLRGTSRYPRAEGLAPLTDREEKVLNLVAEAKTNREIGSELGLSQEKVTNCLSHLLNRFDVQNRSKATRYDRAPQG